MAKRIISGLLAAFVLQWAGTVTVSACKYCEMADDPSLRSYASFPDNANLPADGTSNQLPLPAVPTVLATPPPVTRIVTQASELKAAALKSGVGSVRRSAVPPVRDGSRPASTAAMTRAGAFSAHWADAGLLGLAAAGGVFCWRTRRVVRPVG